MATRDTSRQTNPRRNWTTTIEAEMPIRAGTTVEAEKPIRTGMAIRARMPTQTGTAVRAATTIGE